MRDLNGCGPWSPQPSTNLDSAVDVAVRSKTRTNNRSIAYSKRPIDFFNAMIVDSEIDSPVLGEPFGISLSLWSEPCRV